MSLLDALLLDPAGFHVWISDRADRQRGSGTVSDPYNGGVDAQGISQFDTIMNLPQVAKSYAVIHLGPGTFVTNGYGDSVAGGWQVKPGMKILGSGIDVTTIKLAAVSPVAPTQYFAIGHSLPTQTAEMVDAVEIQDLTIDANLQNANSNAACGAIRVMGNHARVRRVKVINWGTKTTSVKARVISVVIALPGVAGGLEARNSGIEDCWAMTPGPTVTGGRVILFSAGGADDSVPTAKEVHAKSPFIRNCFIDCAVATPSLADSFLYRALSMNSCRGGVVEGNQIYNTHIGGPYEEFCSIRDVAIRNNFFKNVAGGMSVKLGQQGGNLWSSGTTTISWSAGVGTLQGGTTNFSTLADGDRVLIKTTPTDPTVDGIYVIQSVIESPPGEWSFKVMTPVAFPASATVNSIQKIIGVGRAIIEGNIIELVADVPPVALAFGLYDNGSGTAPTPQGPDYPHGDVILKNNKIRYVDGAFNSSYAGFGSEVYGVKNLQAQNNVLDCAPANPLRNSRTGAATYFNNLTPNGGLVQGFKADAPTKKYDELQTIADDSLVLAFADMG